MTKPGKVERSTNLPPLYQARTKDDDDSNFSTQSNYKKFSNFLKESNKTTKQQQQREKIVECNCWVCNVLDSSSSVGTGATAEADTLQYEGYNIVSETGDSIFYDPFLSNIFDNENKLAGEIYIAEDKIRNIIQQDELAKKHYNGRVNFNKNE